MQTFDYARAWREAAKPGFDSLSPEVRALYERVRVECAGLAQTTNLSMPWPDGLRAAFDAIPTDELARAATIVHDFGHWRPAEDKGERTGAHWQFSNYADQVLAQRLDLRSRFERDGNGSSLRIIEGVLRRGYGDRDGWHWEEITRATPENVARLQQIPDPVATNSTHAARDAAWQKRADLWKRLRAELLPLDPCPHFRACVDTARFMFESVKCGECYHDVPAEGARKFPEPYTGAGPKWVGRACGCLTKRAKDEPAPEPIACLCSECGHEWTVYRKPLAQPDGSLYCSPLCRAGAMERAGTIVR